MISKGGVGGKAGLLLSQTSQESPLKKKGNFIVEESKDEGINKVKRKDIFKAEKTAAEAVALLYSSN